ncbi:hypothetical protein LXA43DRAFT_1104514 [Ganoderma leucocontextum]|nr:hypothetical protein LXA43DRAFT_1104514 [Ganoderma leucocontextum]
MSFILYHPPGMHPLDGLDLDSAPTLPVEVIERVVDFLHDDTHALVACSLTCRGLLPAARKHIWYAVHIPVTGDRKPKTRHLAGFLTLLVANPNLHPYVRSLTWAWTSFCGSKPSRFGFKELRMRLWEQLPNLHTLKFYRISFFFVIDPIIELCRTFPHLEELATRGTRKLKRLSISDAMSPRHVSAVAEALLVEQSHASLEVLDLRCVVDLSAPSGRMPSAEALPLLLEEIAPNLRSCGLPIYALEYNAKRVARLYDSAMRCRNLRSLMVQCDTRPDPATGQTLHDTPFLFVEALADCLSRRGDPPLPHLEEVSLWWFQMRRDPPGCFEAFQHLALSLVGDRSRYPALKRLEIRRSAYPSRAEGEPSLYLSEEILRRSLAVVEEAKVQLVVSL